MRQPAGSSHSTLLRGGDESELVQQLLLTELMELLTQQRGEFWFLAAGLEQGGGSRMADMPALDWYAVAEGSGSRGGWQRNLLWRAQRHFLARGEYLSTTALALQHLDVWHRKGLTGRVVLADPEPAKVRAMEPFLYALQSRDREWDNDDWPFRVYQMVGEPTQSLRDMAYGGIVRGPGLALLQPPETMNYAGAWLTLIETLLLRQIWVMIVMPPSWIGGREIFRNSTYRRLREGILNLQYPSQSFRLKGRSLSWKPHAWSETWVLSPDSLFDDFADQAEMKVNHLLADGVGRVVQRGQVKGLKIDRMYDGRIQKKTFATILPKVVAANTVIQIGEERDLPEIVRLWEQLMDEHASFDEHFQRRALSGMYLRQSLMAQLSQPEHLLLVIRAEGKAVGFITAQVLRAPLFHTSRIGQIVDVFLLPAWRGRGFGKALVELAFHWFKSMDLTQIDLNVALGNRVGFEFWERLGFKPYLNVVSRFLDKD